MSLFRSLYIGMPRAVTFFITKLYMPGQRLVRTTCHLSPINN